MNNAKLELAGIILCHLRSAITFSTRISRAFK
jgi:hypothetical protein